MADMSGVRALPEVPGAVHLVMFDTEEQLSALTGLSHSQLWDAGFNLDDWDIGFVSDTKLHRSTDSDEEDTDREASGDRVYADWDLPGYWLVSQMQNYCVGAYYVEYKGLHYYTVHHA